MITIKSIGTPDLDYQEGIAFGRLINRIGPQDPDAILSDDMDDKIFHDACKTAFDKHASLKGTKIEPFTRSSITLFDNNEPEDAQEITGVMTLEKDPLGNKAHLNVRDHEGQVLYNITLSNEEVSQAFLAQKPTSRDKIIARAQRLDNEDLPLINLIQSKADLAVIGDRDELKKLTNYIAHAVLGQQVFGMFEREDAGQEDAPRPAVKTPAPAHRLQ